MFDTGHNTEPNFQAFKMLGAMFTTWNEIAHERLAATVCDDKKELVEQFKRLKNTDTMLALGYVVRHEEKTGEALPQAHVIDALSQASDSTSRDAIRMDIGRRTKALHFFGLIERREITKTHVELRVTELGRAATTTLNEKVGALIALPGAPG